MRDNPEHWITVPTDSMTYVFVESLRPDVCEPGVEHDLFPPHSLVLFDPLIGLPGGTPCPICIGPGALCSYHELREQIEEAELELVTCAECGEHWREMFPAGHGQWRVYRCLGEYVTADHVSQFDGYKCYRCERVTDVKLRMSELGLTGRYRQ